MICVVSQPKTKFQVVTEVHENISFLRSIVIRGEKLIWNIIRRYQLVTNIFEGKVVGKNIETTTKSSVFQKHVVKEIELE